MKKRGKQKLKLKNNIKYYRVINKSLRKHSAFKKSFAKL
jgi:hypothetical protein